MKIIPASFAVLVFLTVPKSAEAWIQEEIIPKAVDPVTVTYAFDECVRPQEPVLATDKRSRGRITLASENQAVRQYNNHVEAANDYMRCIADEAQRDLDAYYKAVSETLDAEQASVLEDLEGLRTRVRARR